MYSASRLIRAFHWLFFGNPSQRRRVKHELARVSAGIFGDYPLSDDYQLWRSDKDFIEDYKRLSPNNYFSQDRKFILREFVRFTENIPGSIAECGCYEGASSFFIAQAAPDTPFHIFDSFEGLSELADQDVSSEKDVMPWKQGDLTASESRIRDVLKGFENINIYKGWIPSRFSEVEGEAFKFVHIDVDLYEPTKDSLDFFYPRMKSGGVMVFDDYGSLICPGAYKAIEEFFSDKKEYVVLLTTGQGLVIKS